VALQVPFFEDKHSVVLLSLLITLLCIEVLDMVCCRMDGGGRERRQRKVEGGGGLAGNRGGGGGGGGGGGEVEGEGETSHHINFMASNEIFFQMYM